MSTTRFRPNLSAKIPERGEMKRAKREVQDVIRDLSRVVSGAPSEELIETKVADITPVSSTLVSTVTRCILSVLPVLPTLSITTPIDKRREEHTSKQ